MIPDYSVALSTRQERSDAETQTLIPPLAHSLRGTGFDAGKDGTGPCIFTPSGFAQYREGFGTLRTIDVETKGGNHVVLDPNQITSAANRSVPKAGESHTLPAVGNAPVAFEWQSGQGVNPSVDICRTLIKNQIPAALHAAGVRRLTPRECERLQGFPDDWTLVPHRNKPAADGPRYKAVGNSMAVPVMRYIAERIAIVEGIE